MRESQCGCRQAIRECGMGPLARCVPDHAFAGSNSDKILPGCRRPTGDGPRTELIEVGPGAVHVSSVDRHFGITCVKGAVWVTSSDRRCDYILREGEAMLLRGRSRIIVSAGRDDSAAWICRE